MTTPRKPSLNEGGQHTLAALTTRLDGHDTRLDDHHSRLGDHDGRLDGHAATLDDHDGRIAALEKAAPPSPGRDSGSAST